MKNYLLAGGASLLILVANSAYAGNTAVNGTAARAQGMQAFTAVADDASAIFYNPAGLTQVKGTQIDNTIMFLSPDQYYKNSINGVSTVSKRKAVGGSLFFSTDKVSKFTFGVGLYSPFARQTDYSKNNAVYGMSHKAKILRLDLVPTAAYQVNDYISIGAGIVGSRVDLKTNIFGLSDDADGYGYTGQGGIMIKLPKRVRLGFTYRGEEKARLDGSGTFNDSIKSHYHGDLRFPAIASAGISWQANDALLLSLAYDYEFWSSFKHFHKTYDNPMLNAMGTAYADGEDSFVIKAGMQYTFKNKDELRAGYAYNEKAIPAANIIPAMPDYDTHVFSIGYSHYYKKFRFDAAYEFNYAPEETGKNPFFPGKYKAHANIFMLGLNYTV